MAAALRRSHPMSPILILAAVFLQDPTAAMVKKTAYTRIPTAQAIAADSEIVGFVRGKNEEGETAAEIRRKDAEWTDPASAALRASITGSACAHRLQALIQDDPLIVEALLMDERGALVCATDETTDYWQGDEAKWQKTFRDGEAVFVDEPAFDDSVGTYAIQLSVPVRPGEERIGALTLTLRLRHAGAAGKP
jgi:hypothetical protein